MNDRVIWFCCFALLFIGMIVGININAGSMTLDALYKVFGIIAGIGTLLTAIIASAALHTWMHQFSHAERFKAFKELEVIGFDCIGAIEKYWGVTKMNISLRKHLAIIRIMNLQEVKVLSSFGNRKNDIA